MQVGRSSVQAGPPRYRICPALLSRPSWARSRHRPLAALPLFTSILDILRKRWWKQGLEDGSVARSRASKARAREGREESFLERQLYLYYNVRSTTSDLQLFLALFLSVSLVNSCLRSLVVDGGAPSGFTAFWRDIYEVLILSFGQEFPEVDSPSISHQAFSVLVAAIGLASFALVLALVEQVVLEVIEENVRRGTRVFEAGHVLVLGWATSQRDLEVVWKTLEQLTHAYRNDGGATVVVLTQRPKLEMEALIKRVLPESDRLGSRFVFREGSPLVPADLETVAARHAAKTIVISDQSRCPEEADAQSVRCAILLDEMCDNPREGGQVVVQMSTSNAIPILRYACSSRVVPLPTARLNARRVAKMVKSPFIAAVSKQIMDFSNKSNLYVQQVPELAGTTFQECAFRFSDTIVLGCIHEDGSCVLNTSPDYMVQAEDQLVLLRPTTVASDQFHPLPTALEVEDQGPWFTRFQSRLVPAKPSSLSSSASHTSGQAQAQAGGNSPPPSPSSSSSSNLFRSPLTFPDTTTTITTTINTSPPPPTSHPAAPAGAAAAAAPAAAAAAPAAAAAAAAAARTGADITEQREGAAHSSAESVAQGFSLPAGLPSDLLSLFPDNSEFLTQPDPRPRGSDSSSSSSSPSGSSSSSSSSFPAPGDAALSLQPPTADPAPVSAGLPPPLLQLPTRCVGAVGDGSSSLVPGFTPVPSRHPSSSSSSSSSLGGRGEGGQHPSLSPYARDTEAGWQVEETHPALNPGSASSPSPAASRRSRELNPAPGVEAAAQGGASGAGAEWRQQSSQSSSSGSWTTGSESMGGGSDGSRASSPPCAPLSASKTEEGRQPGRLNSQYYQQQGVQQAEAAGSPEPAAPPHTLPPRSPPPSQTSPPPPTPQHRRQSQEQTVSRSRRGTTLSALAAGGGGAREGRVSRASSLGRQGGGPGGLVRALLTDPRQRRAAGSPLDAPQQQQQQQQQQQDSNMIFMVPVEYLVEDDRPERVLVAGWSEQSFMHNVLRELDHGESALPPGSEVVFVNTHSPQQLEYALRATSPRNIKVSHLQADPLQRHELMAVGLEGFKCAIVLCDDKWIDPDQDSANGIDELRQRDMLRLDAMVMMVQLNIRKVLDDGDRPTINIICQKVAFEGMTRFEDRNRLPLGISINFSSYSAKLLTQVAYSPASLIAYSNFGENADLVTIDASELADEGEAVSFMAIQRRAQLRRMTLVGWYMLPRKVEGALKLVVNPLGEEARSKARVWNTGEAAGKFIVLRPSLRVKALSTASLDDSYQVESHKQARWVVLAQQQAEQRAQAQAQAEQQAQSNSSPAPPVISLPALPSDILAMFSRSGSADGSRDGSGSSGSSGSDSPEREPSASTPAAEPGQQQQQQQLGGRGEAGGGAAAGGEAAGGTGRGPAGTSLASGEWLEGEGPGAGSDIRIRLLSSSLTPSPEPPGMPKNTPAPPPPSSSHPAIQDTTSSSSGSSSRTGSSSTGSGSSSSGSSSSSRAGSSSAGSGGSSTSSSGSSGRTGSLEGGTAGNNGGRQLDLRDSSLSSSDLNISRPGAQAESNQPKGSSRSPSQDVSRGSGAGSSTGGRTGSSSSSTGSSSSSSSSSSSVGGRRSLLSSMFGMDNRHSDGLKNLANQSMDLFGLEDSPPPFLSLASSSRGGEDEQMEGRGVAAGAGNTQAQVDKLAAPPPPPDPASYADAANLMPPLNLGQQGLNNSSSSGGSGSRGSASGSNGSSGSSGGSGTSDSSGKSGRSGSRSSSSGVGLSREDRGRGPGTRRGPSAAAAAAAAAADQVSGAAQPPPPRPAARAETVAAEPAAAPVITVRARPAITADPAVWAADGSGAVFAQGEGRKGGKRAAWPAGEVGLGGAGAGAGAGKAATEVGGVEKSAAPAMAETKAGQAGQWSGQVGRAGAAALLMGAALRSGSDLTSSHTPLSTEDDEWGIEELP